MIATVDVADTGKYTCEATYKAGSLESAASLDYYTRDIEPTKTYHVKQVNYLNTLHLLHPHSYPHSHRDKKRYFLSGEGEPDLLHPHSHRDKKRYFPVR